MVSPPHYIALHCITLHYITSDTIASTWQLQSARGLCRINTNPNLMWRITHHPAPHLFSDQVEQLLKFGSSTSSTLRFPSLALRRCIYQFLLDPSGYFKPQSLSLLLTPRSFITVIEIGRVFSGSCFRIYCLIT